MITLGSTVSKAAERSYITKIIHHTLFEKFFSTHVFYSQHVFLYLRSFFHPCLLFPTCLFFIQKCFSAHVLYSKHVYQSTVNSHVTRFWKILREPEPHCPPFTSVPCLIFGIVSISLIYQKRYQITNLPNKPWCNCKNNLSEFLKMMLISVFSDVNKYILIKISW